MWNLSSVGFSTSTRGWVACFWLCGALLLLSFACEPSGALRLPDGGSALCLLDTDCSKGARCVSGLCLGENVEPGTEILVDSPMEKTEPLGENATPETKEGQIDSSQEQVGELGKEASAENNNEQIGDAGENVGSEGGVEGRPEILPEPTKPERVLVCKSAEVCGDGVDNNCDGQIDEGCEPCSQSKPCAVSATCEPTGKCKVTACQNNGDCPSDTLCRDDVCVLCDDQEPATMCSTGRICVSGRCLLCGQDSDCTNGQICRQGSCVAPQCTKAADCVNGLVCVSGRCDFCKEDKDCGAQENCVNKVCQQAQCLVTADCPSGLLCVSKRCQGCTTDTECNGVPCDKSVGRCQIQVGSYKQDSTSGTNWQDGTFATSCKEYFDGKPGYIASKTDGVYWLKPAKSAKPFAVYCLMSEKGGGWTLILKADGSRGTFAYDQALWTNDAVHNAPEVQFDLNEAKLESFSTVAFQSVLLALSDIKTGSTRRYLELKKSAPSFQSLMQQGRNLGFDLPVTRAGWLLLLPGAPLQKECNREAFNAHGNKNVLGDYTGIRIRVGILGSSRDGCTNWGFGPRSFVGIGARSFSVNDTSVGANDAESIQDDTKKQMGYLFVR